LVKFSLDGCCIPCVSYPVGIQQHDADRSPGALFGHGLCGHSKGGHDDLWRWSGDGLLVSCSQWTRRGVSAGRHYRTPAHGRQVSTPMWVSRCQPMNVLYVFVWVPFV